MVASNDAFPSPGEGVSSTLDLKGTPVALRRRVAVTEKKSTSESLKRSGINGDTAAGNVNNLHYKIMEQSLLERSKRKEEVNRGGVTSPHGSRGKKGIPTTENPEWKTFLSVVTKVCLLLAAILWLSLLVCGWREMNMYNKGFSFYVSEARLSDVEASFKNIAKMLQVQLDVIDKKIGNEVGIAQRAMKKQMDEKHLLFEEELKGLASQTNKLAESLEGFKGMELLSKEELHNFLNEIKERSLADKSSGMLLDDIRELAKEIVEKEIEKHAADGLGRVDYALAASGARVISHSCPYLVGNCSSWLAFEKGQNRIHPSSHKMLEPSFGEPGHCFALQGNNGFVAIRLKTGIIPEAVTLEHVSERVAFDRSSAPKDCTVTAWFEEPGRDSSVRSEKIFILGEFSYDLEKSNNTQTFKVESVVSGVVNVVRLNFSSNHGSSSHTCIYRFRVHGYEPDSLNVAGQR